MDPDCVARICDEMNAWTTDFCRHIDQVGESLRAERRAIAVLWARYEASLDRRFE